MTRAEAYQVSSGSVQPFGHNTRTLQTGQTGRQADRTDRQRSDSIGRTFTNGCSKRFPLYCRTVVPSVLSCL